LLDVLPPTIQSIQDGWLRTCQNGTIVSALLTAAAAQLLSFFKSASSFDEGRNNPNAARTFLLIICYSSLFFNVSASISSFILIDKLGELPFRASQRGQQTLPPPQTAMSSTDPDYLLKRYGIGRWWSFLIWHWLFCFVLGIWCIILQLLTYIWLQETLPIQISMSCLAAFTLLPCGVFLLSNFQPA
ncbi:hypothetical protein BDQ12DRAFT_750514, partial [Crucibulum laeve]